MLSCCATIYSCTASYQSFGRWMQIWPELQDFSLSNNLPIWSFLMARARVSCLLGNCGQKFYFTKCLGQIPGTTGKLPTELRPPRVVSEMWDSWVSRFCLILVTWQVLKSLLKFCFFQNKILFLWWSVWLIANQINFAFLDQDRFCWVSIGGWVLMIVHVGLGGCPHWCPHSPYHYLRWPTHTTLCHDHVQ